MKHWGFPLACLMGLVLGCSDDLPDAFLLDKLRVLAVIADKPEINATDTTNLSFFITDINGEGRSLTLSATSCVDPGVALGAEPTCAGSATETVVATDLALSTLTAPEYTGLITETLAITPGTTAPSSAFLFANRSDDEQFNGVAILVTLTIATADGTSVSAFKRIPVSTRTDLNTNPTFEANAIVKDGTSLTELPAEKGDVSVDITDASSETYSFIENGETSSETESILTSWFTTDGKLVGYQQDGESPTSYDPPSSSPDTRGVVLVAVIRDRRGGVAVSSVTLP